MPDEKHDFKSDPSLAGEDPSLAGGKPQESDTPLSRPLMMSVEERLENIERILSTRFPGCLTEED